MKGSFFTCKSCQSLDVACGCNFWATRVELNSNTMRVLLYCSMLEMILRSSSLIFQLGLVIDLTNTSRYYLTSDLKKEGIKHVKVSSKCWHNFVFFGTFVCNYCTLNFILWESCLKM